MASSQAWIDALAARPAQQTNAYRDSWREWLQKRWLPVSKLKAEPVVGLMAQRPLRAPSAAGADLSNWQLLQALWRTDWTPRTREDKRLHRQGVALTLLAHLFLALFWLWLTWVNIPLPRPEPAGDHVVQVEYIGTGTPDQTGGGAPNASAPAPLPQPPPALSPAQPQATQPPVAPVAQQTESVSAPSTPVPPPPAQQPLQVSEVAEPDTSFVLPPTTLPQVQPLQTPSTTQITVQPREIVLEEPPEPLPQVQIKPLQPRPSAAPSPAVQEVRQREVALEQPQALPQIQTPQLSPSPTSTPQVNATAQTVRQRDITLNPAPASASTTTATQATTPAGAPATAQATGADSAKPAATASAGSVPAANPGAGPKPLASAGAWPEPKRGDDWGAGNRNRPGGTLGKNGGLHGSDGLPNLPAGLAQTGRGLPPGTDKWTQEQFDRNGTWLKRPPLDYRASRFEQYWRPHETLLQEWVRRGVKQLEIPIPGTSKRISCVVSILQGGGGCGITDPNLNDQEATARPPPDIPFKAELQDDQGALNKPPGSQ